jgi:hypothetical protein
VSHFEYYRHYFAHESAPDFASALHRDSYYTDVSDYRRWLDALSLALPPEQLLVVPFAVVTRSGDAAAAAVCERLGLSPPPPSAARQAAGHRNNVVTFRSDRVRRLTRTLRHSRAYPRVRKVVGADRLRRIRSVVTSVPKSVSFEEALSGCDEGQLAALDALRVSAEGAVEEWLKDQDQRLGLTWAAQWPRGAADG